RDPGIKCGAHQHIETNRVSLSADAACRLERLEKPYRGSPDAVKVVLAHQRDRRDEHDFETEQENAAHDRFHGERPVGGGHQKRAHWHDQTHDQQGHPQLQSGVSAHLDAPLFFGGSVTTPAGRVRSRKNYSAAGASAASRRRWISPSRSRTRPRRWNALNVERCPIDTMVAPLSRALRTRYSMASAGSSSEAVASSRKR